MPDVEANYDGTAVEDAIDGFAVTGRFGYTVDYAKYVNYPTSYSGTSPPFTPIRKWVHRKWNDLDAGLLRAAIPEESEEEGEFDPGETDLTIEEHKDRVAWIVVEAIAENGTEGVYFMERAVGEVETQAEAFAARYANTDDPDAPFKIVRDLVDAGFGISQDIVAEEATDTGNLLQSGFAVVENDPRGNSFEKDGGNA